MTRRRRERGASSIELALYTPVLFLVIFVIVQFALSWHANQVASATAREAARVARADGGGLDAIAAAEQHGENFAAQVGEKALRDVDVDVVQVGNDMRATVTGRALEIIDGVGWTIEETVQGPIERFISDQ